MADRRDAGDVAQAPATGPAPPSKYALPDATRERVRNLYALLGLKSRPCTKCGRMIWLSMGARGRVMPFTDDAVSHFADCPRADEFRRKP